MENGSWAVLGRSGGCRRGLLDPGEWHFSTVGGLGRDGTHRGKPLCHPPLEVADGVNLLRNDRIRFSKEVEPC